MSSVIQWWLWRLCQYKFQHGRKVVTSHFIPAVRHKLFLKKSKDWILKGCMYRYFCIEQINIQDHSDHGALNFKEMHPFQNGRVQLSHKVLPKTISIRRKWKLKLYLRHKPEKIIPYSRQKQKLRIAWWIQLNEQFSFTRFVLFVVFDISRSGLLCTCTAILAHTRLSKGAKMIPYLRIKNLENPTLPRSTNLCSTYMIVAPLSGVETL